MASIRKLQQVSHANRQGHEALPAGCNNRSSRELPPGLTDRGQCISDLHLRDFQLTCSALPSCFSRQVGQRNHSKQ